MANKAIFEGLIVDERGNSVGMAQVGEDACYVINDQGFKKHILASKVDMQVLTMLSEQMKGSEDLLSEQTAKMLGTDDIFSKAMIESQLKNIDKQFDELLKMGIPEESRAYMGMLGFRIIIDYEGEVIKLDQPAVTGDEGGEGL
ncbi:MAG: hypothetical protein ACK2TS_02605 [Anaerolineales bacterium]|jgi:hypothetical protein